MRIESGTTSERRTRLAMFLVMCIVFAGWFGYDGLWGYPAKNLDWAIQPMPVKPENPQTNPRATLANLRQLEKGMSVEEVHRRLGEPIIIQPAEHRYDGPRLSVTVTIEGGKVSRVDRGELKEEHRPERPNYRVTEEALERVEPGISVDELRQRLGEPTVAHERTAWYVGPAAYGKLEIAGGTVAADPEVVENRERTEGDIFLQKLIAAILALLALGVLVKLIRVIRTRVVLDDAGLTFNRTHVSWDAMAGLRTDEYRDKGWLDLEYRANGATRTLRLDSYHIDRFEEIVQAMCERKGFESPLGADRPTDSEPAGSSSDQRKQES